MRPAFGDTISGPRLGIGSFAFRYAIGTADFEPDTPMTASAFVAEAARLGLDGVQLCENLGYAELPDSELSALADQARELGLFLELGMRDLTAANLERHLEIAEIASSALLRIVVGPNQPLPPGEPVRLRERAVALLTEALPRCRQLGLTVGLENHFDLPPRELLRLVEEIDDDSVGVIFDTTNSIGFIERPEESLAILQSKLLSVHLKDYEIRKVEAGYLMSGTRLGEGRLDVEGILRSALAANPAASVILELTIRRAESLTPGEVLAAERSAVADSAATLRELLGQVTTL